MDATGRNRVNVVKGWLQSFGVPALVIAVIIACMAIIAHELFLPVPLDVAITKDLQTSQKIDSEQPAPADPNGSVN